MTFPLAPLRRFLCAATWLWPIILAVAVLLPCAAQAQSLNAIAHLGQDISSWVMGLFIGVVLAATAYLFFIWIVMRDRGQVFLLVFLLCLGVNIMFTNDLMMLSFSITSTAARDFMINLSNIMSWIFGLFFTYYYLELDIYAPGYRAPFVSMAVVLSIILVYSIFDQKLPFFGLSIMGALSVSLMLAAGLTSLRNGTSGSFIHILSFTCYLMGVLSEPAYVMGYIETPGSVNNMTYIAFSLSAMMFSIVVASQFAARQEEKEKALALSNERFMLATRGANEGLFDWNLATGEIFFSDQFRKILGVRLPNSSLGLKRWVRMMLPADRRIVTDAIRKFRRNAKTNTINVEYRITQTTGERRWLHSKAVALRLPGGSRVLRLVGSTSDVTARKLSEVALRASESRFRSITEAHPVPVLIVSVADGAILYASPGAEALLGVRQDLMQQDFIANYLPQEDKRRQLWNEISANKPVDLMEMDMVRNGGKQLPAAVSARRISYQDYDAMVLGLYDLTERKIAEAKIAQQQEALQQSEKMAALGGLLAGVAHELNNPLSVVVGQATLLMEGAQEPKVASRAEKIFKAADRCSRIVKSFLALARRKPPEHKSVDLNQVVRSSLELLGYQIRTADIKLTTELDEALPAVTGDSDQLTQVVTNLLLNAAQALEGWKDARAIVVKTACTDGFVEFTVHDNGPGIPAELRSRIFEPFFTTKSAKGGTGVGLALCLNIVASHGGEIRLTAPANGGACFHVKLPAAKNVIANEQSPELEHSAVAHRMRILLVDDEVELAQTLADLLEPEGHEVDIAANGAIALEKLHKRPFDLIISDLRMPVMDGPALYDALARELPSYLNRIIYVTGDTLSTHVQSFLSQHTVPLVEKPYRLKDIRRALSELLSAATEKK